MSEIVPSPGTPCWVSLLAGELSVAQRFYGRLFGWEFPPGPRHLEPYTRALVGRQLVAGVGARAGGRHLPVAWTMYLASENADLTAERIRDNGGTVAVGPLESDAAGRVVIAADPCGGVFGVWEPREHRGAEVTGEPGAVAWNELLVPDASLVGQFYAAVFGHGVEPASGDRVVLRLGGRAVAGITGLGERMEPRTSPCWRTYFAVADTDAAVARAVELGGTVVGAPEDVGQSRRATLADPEGATFGVVQVPSSARGSSAPLAASAG